MGAVRVRQAKPEEQDRLIQVLTLAFVKDPPARWLYPVADAFLAHFPALTQGFAGQSFQHDAAYVTEDFGGAALWLPPGVSPDPEAMAAFVRETTSEARHEGISEVFGAMGRYRPKDPHWHLASIGVDPVHQGQGTGSALLQATLARVDAEGLPASLESSNPANVPLYERFGFEVMGEIRLPDGPPIFPMQRSSRPGDPRGGHP